MRGICSFAFNFFGKCNYRNFNVQITGPASSGRTTFLLRHLNGRYVDPAAVGCTDTAIVRKDNCVLNMFDNCSIGQLNQSHTCSPRANRENDKSEFNMRKRCKGGKEMQISNSNNLDSDSFDGVLFFIDSSDHGRIPLARKLLSQLIFEKANKRPPILIIATKQDVQGALTPSELAVELNIEDMINENKDQIWDYGIIGVSSYTGLGCDEALDWISEAIWQHQSFCYCIPFNRFCYNLHNFRVLLLNCLISNLYKRE
ncbi:Arl1p/ARF-like GTPase [Cryptosporidium canis]|uniref:Arl1p/ARF-like GTPase n=1 Tax=Cryptosporidium canis TaxID=195482 RepID=A0ABQ8P5P3_9CRYT|nr:Arl1p/ARF-like GTPase [Cryptosporidium canis]KAJ1612251.1 Arl1p/ARF-like GTPase [Cryptosporidium canis]